MESTDYECAIVGGGVAGLSAALVLGRARRRTLLVDQGLQSNRAAPHVGGLLGNDGTPPAALYELGVSQVGKYDSVAMRDGAVVGAESREDGFALELSDGDTVRAQTLVLATGMDYVVPDVPGFADLWGDAVFHCPFCHGWDVRDRRVAVYGAGEMADMQVALMAGWTDDVVRVDPDDVSGVRVEDGTLRALTLHDGSEVRCDAVLLHAALRRRDSVAEQLGVELTEDDFVSVDGLARTSVPGVYAAGDLAFAPQQVAIAQGSGHLAGLVATRELLIGP